MRKMHPLPAPLTPLLLLLLLLALQVWTFHYRCALVVDVSDKGQPIQDAKKSAHLQRVLKEMLGGEGAVVKQETVRGL